jgi:hypothetical protein
MDESLGSLATSLLDPASGVRLLAASRLALIGGEQAATLLQSAVLVEEDWVVRKALQRYLARAVAAPAPSADATHVEEDRNRFRIRYRPRGSQLGATPSPEVQELRNSLHIDWSHLSIPTLASEWSREQARQHSLFRTDALDEKTFRRLEAQFEHHKMSVATDEAIAAYAGATAEDVFAEAAKGICQSRFASEETLESLSQLHYEMLRNTLSEDVRAWFENRLDPGSLCRICRIAGLEVLRLVYRSFRTAGSPKEGVSLPLCAHCDRFNLASDLSPTDAASMVGKSCTECGHLICGRCSACGRLHGEYGCVNRDTYGSPRDTNPWHFSEEEVAHVLLNGRLTVEQALIFEEPSRYVVIRHYHADGVRCGPTLDMLREGPLVAASDEDPPAVAVPVWDMPRPPVLCSQHDPHDPHNAAALTLSQIGSISNDTCEICGAKLATRCEICGRFLTSDGVCHWRLSPTRLNQFMGTLHGVERREQRHFSLQELADILKHGDRHVQTEGGMPGHRKYKVAYTHNSQILILSEVEDQPTRILITAIRQYGSARFQH